MSVYSLSSPANRTLATTWVKQLLLTQPMLPALLLLLSLVSCAVTPVAETRPLLTRQAVKCEHPLIDPRVKEGLYEAIRLYWGAIEDCNAKNGFGPEPDTSVVVVPVTLAAPVTAVPGAKVKTTVEKVTTMPLPASQGTTLPSPIDVMKGLVTPK